jgi:hypothetical protein
MGNDDIKLLEARIVANPDGRIIVADETTIAWHLSNRRYPWMILRLLCWNRYWLLTRLRVMLPIGTVRSSRISQRLRLPLGGVDRSFRPRQRKLMRLHEDQPQVLDSWPTWIRTSWSVSKYIWWALLCHSRTCWILRCVTINRRRNGDVNNIMRWAQDAASLRKLYAYLIICKYSFAVDNHLFVFHDSDRDASKTFL